MSDAEPVRTVDARGLRCPWPALRLARAAREGCGGEHLVVLADDPNAAGEIAALAQMKNWRFERDADCFHIWI